MTYKDFEKYLFGCDHASPVTPSDTGGLSLGTLETGLAAPAATRRLYIGVSGDVKVDTAGGEVAVLFKAVPVGFLDVHATRVYATGTAATNIVALW